MASPAAVSEISGSDRIVVTSLTFRDLVTLLHGHMTWIPHRPFPIGGPLERSEIFNGECDAMVDVTLNTTSKQRHSALAVVTCVLHRRDSWSFLERGQNMAMEPLPSKDLVSGTVYLLSCELQTGSEIFNGERDAMIE